METNDKLQQAIQNRLGKKMLCLKFVTEVLDEVLGTKHSFKYRFADLKSVVNKLMRLYPHSTHLYPDMKPGDIIALFTIGADKEQFPAVR